MFPCTSMHVKMWMGRNIIQQWRWVVFASGVFIGIAQTVQINQITNCVSAKGRARTLDVIMNGIQSEQKLNSPAVLNLIMIRCFSPSLLSSPEKVAFPVLHVRQLDDIKPVVPLQPLDDGMVRPAGLPRSCVKTLMLLRKLDKGDNHRSKDICGSLLHPHNVSSVACQQPF